MRHFSLIPNLVAALVLGLACGARADSPSGAQRRADAAAAALLLRDTQLFADGRGMHVVPGIFEFYELLAGPEVPVNLMGPVKDMMGFNMDGRRAIGLFGIDYAGTRVGVLGCAGCHSGRAAGRTIFGLGNKRIDPYVVGHMVQRVSKPYQWTRWMRPPEQRRLIDDAMHFTALLANPHWSNLTQGMVATSLVRHWFFEQSGQAMPDNHPRGAVKVAHLWGYGEKRKVGQFCDGLGDGHIPGWAVAVELAAGQRPETVRSYWPRVVALETAFEKLLPPEYPFAVDRPLAEKGHAIFEQTCSACHGTYERDADGLPIFKSPNHIPWEVVGTDRDRLDGVTPQFRAMVPASPLADLVKITDHEPGYFAPRLDGIWCRFPYLHNTSVPSVRALLTPPAQRPRVWSLQDAGELDRFDARSLGLTLPAEGSAAQRALEQRVRSGARDVFWVERVGHSNQGHPFGTTLTDDEKTALIEYLKTL